MQASRNKPKPADASTKVAENPWDAILAKNIDIDSPKNESNATKVRRQAFQQLPREPFKKDMTGVYPDLSSRMGIEHYTYQAPIRTQPSNRSSLCSEFDEEDFVGSPIALKNVEVAEKRVWNDNKSDVANPDPKKTHVAANNHNQTESLGEVTTKLPERMNDTASTNTNTRNLASSNPGQQRIYSKLSQDEVRPANSSQRLLKSPKPISQEFLQYSEPAESHPKTPTKLDKKTSADLRSESWGVSRRNIAQAPDQGFEDQSMFFGSMGSLSNQKQSRKLQFEHSLEQISAIKKPDVQSPVSSLAEEDELFDTDSDLKQLHTYLSELSGKKLPPFQVNHSNQSNKTLDFNEKQKSPISVIPEARYSFEERSEMDYKKNGNTKSDAKDRSDHVTNLGRIDEDSDVEFGENGLEMEWNPLRFSQPDDLNFPAEESKVKQSPKPGKWGNLDEETPISTESDSRKQDLPIRSSTMVPETTGDPQNSPPKKKLKIIGVKQKPAINPLSLANQPPSTANNNLAASGGSNVISDSLRSSEVHSLPHASKPSKTASNLEAKEDYRSNYSAPAPPVRHNSEGLPFPRRVNSPPGGDSNSNTIRTVSLVNQNTNIEGELMAERDSPQGPITLKPAPDKPSTQTRSSAMQDLKKYGGLGVTFTKTGVESKVVLSGNRPLVNRQDLLNLFSRKRVQSVVEPLVAVPEVPDSDGDPSGRRRRDNEARFGFTTSTSNRISGVGGSGGGSYFSKQQTSTNSNSNKNSKTNTNKQGQKENDHLGPARSYTQELAFRWDLGRTSD